MIGGLLKSSSKLALMAAAGILVGGVGMGTAKAADLGGDCCADLEERVAELEATTVRKGNRKVSLTLSGQIDKQIMYMRDDIKSRTVAGVDNINSSTRFIFSGDAKISSSVKAGFEMMMEWSGSNRSDLINQFTTLNQNWTVDGKQTLANTSGDGSLSVRTANWWLEDKVLGRVSVGRVNIQGPSSIIDISGGDVGLIAGSNPYLMGGALYLGSKSAGYYNATLQTLMPYCYGCSREEGIRWDSVSIGGLLLGAFWGEQDRFTVQARYAGEFAGFQVAAGAGYQHDNNLGNETNTTTSKRTDTEQQAYALSVKHIASGIFVQGNTGITHWKVLNNIVNPSKSDGTMWQIQAGWAKNVFGPGMSTIYGEYGHAQGYASGASTSSIDASAVAGVNLAGIGVITSDKADYYGVGVTQKLDAAAMTLYLGWRHFDPKVSTAAGSVPLSGVDTVIGGARIQF